MDIRASKKLNDLEILFQIKLAQVLIKNPVIKMVKYPLEKIPFGYIYNRTKINLRLRMSLLGATKKKLQRRLIRSRISML